MVVSMMLSFMEVEVSSVIDDVAKPTITIAVVVVSMMLSFMEVDVLSVTLGGHG